MAEQPESGEISSRLHLKRPTPPGPQTLRSRGVTFTPIVAAAQSAAEEAKAAADAPPAAPAHEVPGVVLLIGLYEFVRAVTLAVIFGLMIADPHTHMFSEGFWTVFYVLSNGAPGVTPFLPLTIIYAFAVGSCLWMRVNWGRRALIATSCWAVVRLATFLAYYRALDLGVKVSDPLMAPLSLIRDAAFMLAAVNIVIGLYLSFAPGVAEYFGKQK